MTGLVIRDSGGNILLDMTRSVSQTTGDVVTHAVNGSITLPPPPAGKTAFFIVVPLEDLNREKGHKPGVVLQNNTLSWAYSYNPDPGWGYYSVNCRIYYGHY